MNLATDIYPALEAIPWLSMVGQPEALSLDFETTAATNAETALAMFHSDSWADVKTEAQGDLTGYLAKHHYAAYGSYWNALATHSRALVEKVASPNLASSLRMKGFPIDMVRPILLDVNRAALEISYRRRFPKAPVFFEKLLRIYQLGHLPCGWTGDQADWPLGILIVL